MKQALLSVLAATMAAGSYSTTAAAQPAVGAAYTMTNLAAGNAVVVYRRGPDGALTMAGTVPTGGAGTGAGLGNQGGVVLSDDQRWLYVINAGSHELTVFAVNPQGLRWVDKVATGGTQPISVAASGRLVYVVHAGSDDISGFRQSAEGTLSSIPGSARPLSAPGADPAQIGFSPDGRFLIVTEKATNVLSVFPVDDQGVAGDPVAHASAGATPFGFAFGKRGQLFVSEAFGGPPALSAVSSYVLQASGGSLLQVVSPSVTTNQLAACWVVTTTPGRFLYTTNTASHSVSGYAVEPDGSISLLDPSGVSAATPAGPIDAAITQDGRYLYVLTSGGASISRYRVGGSGALEPLGTAAVPGGANGLAVR